MTSSIEVGGPRYYGKYGGIVKDNGDPDGRGRLLVEVPAVTAHNPSTWVEACLPLAGAPSKAMGVFCVPPPLAEVWVEFEGGHPDFPIWSGCRFRTTDDVPQPAAAADPRDSRFVIQTKGQNSIVLSDVAGEGISLRSSSGAEITINQDGIKISVPGGANIELKGTTVNINGEALEVT